MDSQPVDVPGQRQLFIIRGTQDSRLEGFKIRGLGPRLKTLDIPVLCCIYQIRRCCDVNGLPILSTFVSRTKIQDPWHTIAVLYIKSGGGEVPKVVPSFLHLYPRPRFKTLGTPVLSCISNQAVVRCQWLPQPFYTW